MELGTFGAILSFALEFEEGITNFFAAAAEKSSDDAAEVFADLAKAGNKRLKSLERTRRENVAEMILEPIMGFRSEDYPCDTKVAKDAAVTALVKQALAVEKTAVAYYQMASQKVTVPEVARILNKMAEQHAEQRETLEELGK